MSLSVTEAKGRLGKHLGWECANDLRRALSGIAEPAARRAARQDYSAAYVDGSVDRIDTLRSAKS